MNIELAQKKEKGAHLSDSKLSARKEVEPFGKGVRVTESTFVVTRGVRSSLLGMGKEMRAKRKQRRREQEGPRAAIRGIRRCKATWEVIWEQCAREDLPLHILLPSLRHWGFCCQEDIWRKIIQRYYITQCVAGSGSA